MKDKVASGAMCLDGSPAGYYLREATHSVWETKWLILFGGGGWCYNERDCLLRAQTTHGSSKHWDTQMPPHGIGSEDCTVSPFCGYNVVQINYCDGTSFSSELSDPIVYNGTQLYFRGRRNYEAVLESLFERHGLGGATEVLLSGCSAGGMSAYLHSNSVERYVRKIAKNLERFKTAPGSGLFVDYESVFGRNLWSEQMHHIVSLTNMTASLDGRCVAEHGWRCVFPVVAYQYITAPVFVINSAVDLYSLMCFLVADVPGFPESSSMYYPLGERCLSNGVSMEVSLEAKVEACPVCPGGVSALQDSHLLRFFAVFDGAVRARKPGDGAFIHTCISHCTIGDTFAIESDGFSLKPSLFLWWESSSGEGHYYIPKDMSPRDCGVSAPSVWSRAWLYCVAAVSGVLVFVLLGVLLWCRGRETRSAEPTLPEATQKLTEGADEEDGGTPHGLF